MLHPFSPSLYWIGGLLTVCVLTICKILLAQTVMLGDAAEDCRLSYCFVTLSVEWQVEPYNAKLMRIVFIGHDTTHQISYIFLENLEF